MDRGPSSVSPSPFVMSFPSANYAGRFPDPLNPPKQATFPYWSTAATPTIAADPYYDAAPLRSRAPQTYAQWIREAKQNTQNVQKNGSDSPVTWMFVQGTDIPSSAVIAGEDRGRPLFIARTFYERNIEVGKAGRHFRLGAKISYGGIEVDVGEYEVLVEASIPTRWTFQSYPLPQVSTSAESQVQSFQKAPSFVRRTLEHDLKEVKVVVLVDDSLSMANAYWHNVREVLGEVAEMAKNYSADGLDIYFLNNDHSRLNVRDKYAVDIIFQVVVPSGQTPTGSRLQDIFDIYIPRLDVQRGKPLIFLVITDGAPTDDPEAVIVDTARRLEGANIPLDMLSVQFMQIGDDPEAAAALKKLDDDLEGLYGIRDMVTATVFDRLDPDFRIDKLVKVLTNSIERALNTPRAAMAAGFGGKLPFPSPARKQTV